MASIFESIPATDAEVEAFGRSLKPAYLHCRVWGHDPEPHNVVVVRDVVGHPAAVWDVSLRCTHGCGVKWIVLASGEGEVLRRRLDYSEAPGYLSEHGRIGKGGKQILRRQFLIKRTKPSKRKEITG